MPPQPPEPRVLSDEDLEGLTKIIESLYDRAGTYTKVVLGIGYAALFSVWSGTKNDLTAFQRLFSAFLATFSLFSFVVYEVVQMVAIGKLNFKLGELHERYPTDLRRVLTEFAPLELKVKRRYRFWWIVALYLTIPTGIGAAAVLMWAFVRQMFRLP